MKILVIILSVISLQASAANIYFAATGNDGSGTGAIGSPYQSITKLNTLSLSSGDFVLFNGGDTFTGEITPKNGVTYKSYGTGKAIVSAYSTALQSSGAWTNAGGGIWEASLDSGWGLDVVVKSGAFVQMGRSPNAGSYWNIDSHTNPDSHGNDYAFFPDQPGYDVTVTSSSLTGTWTGAFVVARVNDYQMDRLDIRGQTGTTININTHSGNQWFDNWKFFVQGAEATLDQQGEWYYNRSTHKIRIVSSTNPATAGYKFSQYSTNFNIVGNGGSFYHDITIDNLKLEGADSIGVVMNFAYNITIQNSDFNFSGWHAIEGGMHINNTGIPNICYNISVLNNTMTDNGGCGVFFNYSNNLFVKYNTVLRSGINEGMGTKRIGIHSYKNSNTDSLSFIGNDIQYSGYVGLYFQGQKAVVLKNNINEFGLMLRDGGGIYTSYGDEDGSTGKRLVAYNVVTNGHGGIAGEPTGTTEGGMPGIYMDDNTSYVDINSNTVSKVTRASIFLHNTVSINVINNNVNASNGELALALEDDNLGNELRGTVVRENKFYTLPGANLVQLKSDLNDYSSMGTFSSNYYSRSTTGNLFNTIGNVGASYSFASWKNTFGWDAGTAFTQVIDDSVRLEYNSGAIDKYVLLPNTYTDLTGAKGYYRYVKIAPYSSLLLYRKTFASIRTSRPVKFVP